MNGGFGERLRRRREEQQIDLAAIAELTKIKRSLLEALERDDISQWPSGIFRRAWVRTYAQAIGLDAETTVREFVEAHPEPEDVAPVEAVAELRPDPGLGGLRGIVGAAIGSLSRRIRTAQAEPPTEVAPAEVRPPEVTPPLSSAPRRETEIPEAKVPVPPIVEAPAPARDIDLPAIARLCTRFGQAGSAKDVQPLLQEVATTLDATGLIVWLWHSSSAVLRPALVYGYSAGVVARLPAVTPDADNPTAASFRSGQSREIDSTGGSCGALVLPLLLRAKCVGVLAIELRQGTHLSETARAVATILAAAIAQLVSRSNPIESKAASSTSPARRARLTPVRGTA